MTAKSDEDGFLIGENEKTIEDVVDDLNTGMIAGQNTSNKMLGDIRTDVSAIAKAIRSSPMRSVVEPAGRGNAISPRDRSAEPSGGRQAVAAQTAGIGYANARVTVSPAGRDGRGRFTAGNRGGSQPGVDGKPLLDMLGHAKDVFKRVGTGTEQMDPSLTAMKEVKNVVEPLGRGAMALFGRSKGQKNEGWYKKIWKSLTNIEKKPTNTGPGGMPSMDSGDSTLMGGIAGLATRFIPAIVPVVLGAIGVLVAAGMGALMGTAIGNAIYDWLTKSGLMTKIFDSIDSVIVKFKNAKEAYAKGENEARSQKPGDPKPAPVSSVSEGVGRAVGNFKRGSDYMAGAGGRNVAESIAIKTGNTYSAGNIGGLSEASTRALVASTALTESSGGKLGVVNKAGYMGRYQAGAGWLADAGLIKGGPDSVKAAMAKDNFSNEEKWGLSGGMTKFLKNDANWKDGMNYTGYLASADVQDKAFKTNSDAAYNTLMKKGTINANTPEPQVAGLLKARHLSGLGGAMKVAAGGVGPNDSNGTNGRKYYDDLATDRHGFISAYSVPPVPSSVPTKLPPAPEIKIPSPSSEKDKPLSVSIRQPIGQNVSDRGIANVATGAIGATGQW